MVNLRCSSPTPSGPPPPGKNPPPSNHVHYCPRDMYHMEQESAFGTGSTWITWKCGGGEEAGEGRYPIINVF